MAGIAVTLSFKMQYGTLAQKAKYSCCLATAAAVRYFFVDQPFIMFWIMFAAAILLAEYGPAAGYLASGM